MLINPFARLNYNKIFHFKKIISKRDGWSSFRDNLLGEFSAQCFQWLICLTLHKFPNFIYSSPLRKRLKSLTSVSIVSQSSAQCLTHNRSCSESFQQGIIDQIYRKQDKWTF